jgi:hypothetical protein
MPEAETMERVEPYPEHVKLKAVSGDSQKIGEFLEWLQNGQEGEDRQIALCVLNRTYDQYMPIREGIQDILARYFDIDLKVIEQEKRAMLDEIREHNNA